MNWRSLKEKLEWKGFRSIEFRMLGWAARAIGAGVFLIYLATNAPGAWAWAEAKWVRTQDLSRLEGVLERAKASGDYSWAEKWVKDRPFSESKELIARATPYSAGMSPFFFFDFSDRAEILGDREQADLWNMIANYRLRFDLLRCGISDGVEQGGKLIDLFAMANGNFHRDMPTDKRMRLVPQVMAFDDKYPATNDPAKLCKLLHPDRNQDYRPLARNQWESFRKGLHRSTEISIDYEKKKALKDLKKDQKK